MICENQSALAATRKVVASYRDIAMKSGFLERHEVAAMTKFKQPKKQCAWLSRAGIWFQPDRDGYPVTTWDHVNNPISLRLAEQRRPEQDSPNFDAM